MESSSENPFATSDTRSSVAEIREQAQHVSSTLFPGRLFDAVPNLFLLLNENRQIVYTNHSVMNLLKLDELHAIIGLRPGEALRCLNSGCNEHGCGTSEFCYQCGANLVIRESLSGRSGVRECNLLRRGAKGETEAFDLLVWGAPFELEGRKYSAFSIMDNSHEKRRRVLERIFFHDILNIAGGIQTYVESLAYDESCLSMDDLHVIHQYTHRLVEEIKAQKELSAAENNELTVHPTEFDALELLEDTVAMYREHDAARNKTIRITPDSGYVTIFSDAVLLGRVLGNMLKNAFEASREGDTVAVGCTAADAWVEFRVSNSGVIPADIQTRIFQRSFSTKGADRGLGTYSLRLLTERYLQGNVHFTSTVEEGTTFLVRLPIRISPPEAAS